MKLLVVALAVLAAAPSPPPAPKKAPPRRPVPSKTVKVAGPTLPELARIFRLSPRDVRDLIKQAGSEERLRRDLIQVLRDSEEDPLDQFSSSIESTRRRGK